MTLMVISNHRFLLNNLLLKGPVWGEGKPVSKGRWWRKGMGR
jgi:hypothetical protein